MRSRHAYSLVAAALTAATLAAIQPAAAAKLEGYRIGAWSGGAYSKGATRAFSHCAVQAKYKSGIYLLFSVGRTYRWSMGLANAQWTLNKGAQYTLAYDVDGGPRTTVQGRANTPSLIEIPLADSATLFRLFQKGRKLNVIAAGGTFSFRLDDSARALQATLGCARKYAGTGVAGAAPAPGSGAGSSNPFAPAPGGSAGGSTGGASGLPAAGGLSLAERRVEAATTLANTLSASGIKDFRVIPIDRAPEALRKADGLWTAPGLLGTLDIVVPGKPMTPEEMTGVLLQRDAKKCAGTFASGRRPGKTGTKALRLSTSCQRDGKSKELEYSIVQRPKGGFYVYAVTAVAQKSAPVPGLPPQAAPPPGAPAKRRVPDLDI